jgi:hypothetical protein
MKNFFFFLFIAGCLLVFCKEPQLQSFKMKIGKIHKIELLDDADVTFGSADSTKIGQFVSFLLTAGKDNTGRDFVSHDFIKFQGSNGDIAEIEIFKNFFKTKGSSQVFVVESSIVKKMRAIFDNSELIETPALNTR